MTIEIIITGSKNHIRCDANISYIHKCIHKDTKNEKKKTEKEIRLTRYISVLVLLCKHKDLIPIPLTHKYWVVIEPLYSLSTQEAEMGYPWDNLVGYLGVWHLKSLYLMESKWITFEKYLRQCQFLLPTHINTCTHACAK